MAARVGLSATTETTVTTEVRLKPSARQMVVQRCEEHDRLGEEIKTRKGRQERIRDEVVSVFQKEKQGKALLAGTKIGDYRMKFVGGETKKFDQMGFMKKHGLSQADFDEFTDKVPKKSYVNITGPNAKKYGGDE